MATDVIAPNSGSRPAPERKIARLAGALCSAEEPNAPKLKALHPTEWQRPMERLKSKLQYWQPSLSAEIDRLDDNGAFLLVFHRLRRRAGRLHPWSGGAWAAVLSQPLRTDLIRFIAETPLPMRDAITLLRVLPFAGVKDIDAFLPEDERPRRWAWLSEAAAAFSIALLLTLGLFLLNWPLFWAAGGGVYFTLAAVAGLGALALILALPNPRLGYAFFALALAPLLAGQWRAVREPRRQLVYQPLIVAGLLSLLAALNTGLALAANGMAPGAGFSPEVSLAALIAGWTLGAASLRLFARNKQYDFDNLDRLAEQWRHALREDAGRS